MNLRTVTLGLAAFATLAPAAAATLNVVVQDADGKPLADAVVLLEPAGAAVPVKPMPGVEIAQENKHFISPVTVVTVGTSVSFPNRDTVRHHVYSFSPAKVFELKLYIGKPANPVVFDRAGVVVLGCNIHDSMVGYVIVSDTPWFGKSAANGRVALADVPAGAYRLRTWHPDLPVGSSGIEQTVTVSAAAQDIAVRMKPGEP